MTLRRLLVATSVAVTFAGFSLPSYAEDGYVRAEPPARRTEKYEHKQGQVWVPGTWEWRDGKHEWVQGHYVAERKGYRYEPDRWVQHDNEQWMHQRGGWSRDQRD